MTPHDHPLFEFDPSVEAVINPSIHRPMLGFPQRAVMCWFGNVVRDRTVGLEPLHNVPFEHGDHPICVIATTVTRSPWSAPAWELPRR